MSLYKSLVRPILFKVDPEKIHHLTFKYLKILQEIGFVRSFISARFKVTDTKLEKEVFGIKFPNPIGLAAGLDKNAEAFDILGDMGFGFVEIGTITPVGQEGNPKPRIFRFPESKALVNRMGFNNKGITDAVIRLRKKKSNVIIGGNIGKNKLTPNEEAVNDYLLCFEALYKYVDYFVVNVSSPNTPNLRALQDKAPLKHILNTLMNKNAEKPKMKPILLKIAPDLTDQQIDDIVEIVVETKIAGIVATNTTISRKGLEEYSEDKVEAAGAGGLSGDPVRERSTQIIKHLRAKLPAGTPIIGVGGIMDTKSALEKLDAGADLIQLYTGFIYEGPMLIREINKELIKK